jgi:ABC-type phosphate transport system permease subunit
VPAYHRTTEESLKAVDDTFEQVCFGLDKVGNVSKIVFPIALPNTHGLIHR